MGIDDRLPSARVSVSAMGLSSWGDGRFGEAIRDVQGEEEVDLLRH